MKLLVLLFSLFAPVLVFSQSTNLYVGQPLSIGSALTTTVYSTGDGGAIKLINSPNASPGIIQLQWNWIYPPGASNQTFAVRHSTNLALPVMQWPVFTNILAGANLSLLVTTQPGQHYFALTALDLSNESNSPDGSVSQPLLRGVISTQTDH
jgi:hypothetical protein